MKVLIDAETEKILGAAILGIGGDEIIHFILNVMYAYVTYWLTPRTRPTSGYFLYPFVAEYRLNKCCFP
jgi:pyruvate/2-oxoglutarate dehydrogenase complex dihydrolipoamide dehydrogenase (E3) component